MTRAFALADAGWPEPAALRAALERADAQLDHVSPVLEHLLSARDQSLFSDFLVARVRGMLIDLARQMLRVQAEATGEKAREHFAESHCGALAERLFATPVLVAHCHALALEWQLGLDLETRFGVDQVLSPLIQQRIGDRDPEVASSAMAALAAQTRFVRQQRRMALPLTELDAECFHTALRLWRAYGGEEGSDALTRAEGRLRASYDEGEGRLAMLARLVAALGPRSVEALNIQAAGAALFLSALAIRSNQPRTLVARSTNAGQLVRLALGLRAAGLKAGEVDLQLLSIHPDMTHATELDDLGTREASKWLSTAGGIAR
ncbi:hypothetical protein [Qipengyuania spongiae]|uniref:DUF2336 domain-containing protein n=1 Tax=Qipengyuania spongiae TaxID=2909673 RepID=A0ABY5SWL1_9SPHN|nr:hypothetical protein [Qipengyuania spongiae]UVI38938.1 hypothetical protein L1F33_11935 [Qipengyuania spongiae]